jgi:hypothetical protein
LAEAVACWSARMTQLITVDIYSCLSLLRPHKYRVLACETPTPDSVVFLFDGSITSSSSEHPACVFGGGPLILRPQLHPLSRITQRMLLWFIFLDI